MYLVECYFISLYWGWELRVRCNPWIQSGQHTEQRDYVYRNQGPPGIGCPVSSHPNELSRVGSLFRPGVVGTLYLCAVLAQSGYWLAGTREVERQNTGQSWGGLESRGVRYVVGGGRQELRSWGTIAAGVVLMNVLGDVVHGSHGGAVPAGVSTGNSPHQHREPKNRGGFNMEWLENWEILWVPPPW